MMTNKINVSQLSAISANVGTLTSGEIRGVLIQTAISGQRVVLESGVSGLIRFYSSSYETAIFYGSGADIMIATSQSSGKILLSVGASGAIAFAVGGTIKSYFDAIGDLHIGAGNATLDNSSNTADLRVNKNFLPASNNAYTLGSSGLRWSDLRAVYAVLGYITIGAGGGYDILPYGNNYGQIGYTGQRWDKGYFNSLYCTTQTAGMHITGDLKFRHKGKIVFKIDENPNFLNFYNKKGEMIMRLSNKGELFIKGEVKKL